MANSFLTAQWVARKSTILVHQKSNMAGRANRDHQEEFAPLQGVPRGTTVSVRLPFKYIGRSGNSMAAENSVQRFVPLTLSNQFGCDVNFSSIERAQDLGDFEEQVLDPMLAQVSAKIENSVGAVTLQIPKLVGSYNTSVSMSQLMAARRLLTEALAPEDMNRTLTANPQAHEEFVNNNATLFNPETSISEQFIEGVIAERVAGATAFENTKIATWKAGTVTGGTPTVSGAGQGLSGSGNAYASTTSLVTSQWNSGATTLNVGDVLSISNVNDVDPETKQSLGRLKQFVVTSQVSDSSGNLTVVISPAIIYGGAYQNVDSQPQAGANITYGGTDTLAHISGLSLKQSLMWHRDAILFACVPMQDLSTVCKFYAQETYDGFTVRVSSVYDIDNDFLPLRLDTLSAVIAGDASLAVRIVHPATAQ